MGWILGKLSAYLWPVMAGAFLSLFLWGSWGHWKASHNAKAVQECKDARSLDAAAATTAALVQTAQFRAEEQRRAQVQQEKIDETERQLTRERADRVIADAAAGRLLQRFNAAVAAAREAARNPTPSATGAPAPAADLPADMFSRVLDIARQYRDAAESAITAGELAERDYDALTAK